MTRVSNRLHKLAWANRPFGYCTDKFGPGTRAGTGWRCFVELNVEPKLHHVAVLHYVLFAFHAYLAGGLGVVHASRGH